MKSCKNCGQPNGAGVLFCHNCGNQLESKSKEEIEHLKHSSQCSQCDYYNPIEDEVCARCGYSLRTDKGFLIRDSRGRRSYVRELELGRVAKFFAYSSMLAVIVLSISITAHQIHQASNLASLFLEQRGILLLAFWLGLTIFTSLDWGSGILYKLKTSLVLLLALFAIDAHLGKPNLALFDWTLDDLCLWVLLSVITFGVLYVIRGRIIGSLSAAVMAFIGLYSSISPIVVLLRGGGFLASLQYEMAFSSNGAFFLKPAFVCFHVFLPYCFILMMGSTLAAFLKSMEKVDGTRSIDRFLNRRKEEARGELLNLFIIGIMIHLGLMGMHQLGEANLIEFMEYLF